MRREKQSIEYLLFYSEVEAALPDIYQSAVLEDFVELAPWVGRRIETALS
ncbi:hypothetical protein [Endozoicomonas ascidiicola]|nr:hypothetical protein [Endozoicomonas ascidiicola]